MDIKAFLSSGTTHVHTKEPQGNFAKSAKAVVLALSLGAASGVSADNTAKPSHEPVSRVSLMPYAGDEVSILYQALLAPKENDSIRVVSTRSGAVVSLLQTMPSRMQSVLNTSPDNVSMAVRNMDKSPFAVSVGSKWDSWLSSGVGSVCMVNAVEAVTEHTKYANGAPYVSLAQLSSATDHLAQMASMSVSEATQVTMIHELSHCEFNLKSNALLGYDPADQLEGVFRASFNEAAADLGVVLYYASQEGSFTNGRLAIGSVRAAANNGDHSTMAMLDVVLSRLDPEDFKGMPINQVFQAVTPVMNDAWNEQSADLRKAFFREIVEGELLSKRLQGQTSSLTMDDVSLERVTEEVPDFTYNAYGKAHEKINQVLDNGLRNPDFQRQLGFITVAKIEEAASKMGVQLAPEQLIKARFLDPQFSPPGTKGEVGLAGTADLREVNHLNDLQQQAKQNLEMNIRSAPRFN